ncbi:hypothetical protein [Desulfurococcus mucosus]|uniref:Uncharacterized protein n=1 Tax=Desulfurococcus mucosus (strain ATCC 35584 / DSM 2162 / JCM 9187 / O7/1) TaxID=765177 RepID=E8RAI0_DESM0|nr:hypothetical protein [Desulfurococcus mucosus]ADV64390.1 hypothetical protein Desmu_0071 [Desulfurococcus mucosus DSM 2162]
MTSKKSFSGVVIGIEQVEGYDKPLLYVHGEAEGYEGEFYVLVPDEELENYMRLGIGQRIEGVGVEESGSPLVLRKLVV